MNVDIDNLRDTLTKVTNYLHQSNNSRKFQEEEDKRWKKSAGEWMQGSNDGAQLRVTAQHATMITLESNLVATIACVNKLTVQLYEQQKQITFLMEKSQMTDATERLTVTPIDRSEPLTAPTFVSPAVMIQPAPPVIEVTTHVDPPLPPEIVQPTDDHAVIRKRGNSIWKRFLVVFCLVIILTMAIVGKNPTIRFVATNVKGLAKYIEDITSDDKVRVKAQKRLSNDDGIMADGHPVNRRRNPARQQWADDEM
jgi:hypothetical protein